MMATTPDRYPAHIPAPLIELLKLIPPPGSNWPVEDRVRWLQAFDSTCRFLYKDEVQLLIRRSSETQSSQARAEG